MTTMHRVHVDWGGAGAARVDPAGILVVVDVLSFTTAVSIGVEREIAVHPCDSRRPGAAAALAAAVGAELAVARRDVTAGHPWSLSPATLRVAPAPASSRLVLASPNGSAIAASARSSVVAAACLRNVAAVADWLRDRLSAGAEALTVVAAGERWEDGSLRPALEDALGAGAVISALGERDVSPEAAAARAAYDATPSVAAAVRGCVSGLELDAAGFAQDVEIALETDASDAVPVLVDGAFRYG